MSRLKQIMYGVTDFARMRAENAYFVEDIIAAGGTTGQLVDSSPAAQSSFVASWSSSTAARSSCAKRSR